MESLSESDHENLVRSRVSGAAFKLVSSSLQPLPTPGVNVLAQFSVLQLSVRLTSTGQVSELRYLVKTPPSSETCAEFVTKIRAFYKEPAVYNTILSEFDNHIGGNIGPGFFLAKENFIVLDNILDFGFRKLDLKREFTLHHCELVVESLAKLHAASLVLEETKSAKIPELYPDILFETVYSDETDHPGFDFMCVGINALELLIKTHFTYFPKNVIKQTMTMMRNLPFKLKPSEDFRNVLNHGGVWADNALFDYGVDSTPGDVRLIDFSSARYAPPACDVLLFLHLTTSRAFREYHQGALLTHYYSKLAKEVQTKGLDLADLLPWAEFETSCRHYLDAAIVASLLQAHVTLLPEETLASLAKDESALRAFLLEDRSEVVLAAYTSDEVYRRRLGQVVVQALEYTQFRGRRRSSMYVSA